MTGTILGWRIFLPVLCALLVTGASDAADPVEGGKLAEQWCASCHAIAPGEASREPIPSFESIIQDRGRSAEWLTTWLSTPHETMPDLSLTRQEIADLVAYLESMK